MENQRFAIKLKTTVYSLKRLVIRRNQRNDFFQHPLGEVKILLIVSVLYSFHAIPFVHVDKTYIYAYQVLLIFSKPVLVMWLTGCERVGRKKILTEKGMERKSHENNGRISSYILSIQWHSPPGNNGRIPERVGRNIFRPTHSIRHIPWAL
jgi:hypothetical protein